MEGYKFYIFSTICYGVAAIVGVVATIYFLYEQIYLLAILGVVFTYVAVDNFFCGSRAEKCGLRTHGRHYILPPFMKGKT